MTYTTDIVGWMNSYGVLHSVRCINRDVQVSARDGNGTSSTATGHGL